MTNNDISSGVVHELPEDLRKTLASDAEARAAWEGLTPLARNEWICWAISVKKPETRNQHVERVYGEKETHSSFLSWDPKQGRGIPASARPRVLLSRHG